MPKGLCKVGVDRVVASFEPSWMTGAGPLNLDFPGLHHHRRILGTSGVKAIEKFGLFTGRPIRKKLTSKIGSFGAGDAKSLDFIVSRVATVS